MMVQAIWENHIVLIHASQREKRAMGKKMNDESILHKQVFTTGEAAKICNVSQQTIIRCFDSGRLQGFKVPGSRFRRIPRAELIKFMQQNNMEVERLDSGPVQVLVIGIGAAEVDMVIRAHSVGHHIQIHHADDAWTAGFLANELKPGLILLNPELSGVRKSSILKTLGNDDTNSPMIVIVNNNYPNGLNVSSQFDDSKEVIKQAVQQLLSA